MQIIRCKVAWEKFVTENFIWCTASTKGKNGELDLKTCNPLIGIMNGFIWTNITATNYELLSLC